MTNAAASTSMRPAPSCTRETRVAAVRRQRGSRTCPTSRRSTIPSPRSSIPGDLMTNSFNIAQNGEKTNFLTTISQQRQDGVLRDHGGYDRTDFRINLDHRPRDDVQFSVSGYHSRSQPRRARRQSVLQSHGHGAGREPAAARIRTARSTSSSPTRRACIRIRCTWRRRSRTSRERIRTLGSMDLRYTPRSWLSARRQRELRPLRREPVVLPRPRAQVGEPGDRRPGLA